MTTRLAATFASLFLLTLPAIAQGLFEPVARVNERVITKFEYDQRVQMLELFQVPGDIRTASMTRLIEERAARGAGAHEQAGNGDLRHVSVSRWRCQEYVQRR